MRYFFTSVLLLLITYCSYSQEKQTVAKDSIVIGKVINAQDGTHIGNVNVLNLNQVKGTITAENGEFNIRAAVNDTLYFSYLGFKSRSVRVTNDMINIPGTVIDLTELAYALEDVVVTPYQLTGILEIDARSAPVNDNQRYQIPGLNTAYEGGSSNKGAVSKVLNSIFNPADFLYNIFGNKPQQMRKLRQIKDDESIRSMLATKFDRETLIALLQVTEEELEEILAHCNYSKSFIQTANDLQILDAVSGCYEEYKILHQKNK